MSIGPSDLIVVGTLGEIGNELAAGVDDTLTCGITHKCQPSFLVRNNPLEMRKPAIR